MQKKDIKWSELGFSYIKTDKRYISRWKDGKWDDGQLVEDNMIPINEGSTCLHYGQECFEGLKAYSTKDGGIQLFRPDENAKRMQKSCAKVLMTEVPNGTGKAKVGGNYAASLLSHKEAVDKGFADCIYLDPSTHTKIDEVGAANFFGLTKDNKFITPHSSSILPSITRISLMQVAKDYLGMEAIETDVYVDKLDMFTEAGACGTAAVITPIGGIEHKGKFHVFHSETEVGPVTKKLYDTLYGIQMGDVKAPEGWIYKVK